MLKTERNAYCLKTKTRMAACYKDTGNNLKKFPIAKNETI
jgi:hypothetical protein